MITFAIEWGGSACLTVGEVWPDGDAPENPTWEDVATAMAKSRNLSALCREWNLAIEEVTVNGHDSGLQ